MNLDTSYVDDMAKVHIIQIFTALASRLNITHKLTEQTIELNDPTEIFNTAERATARDKKIPVPNLCI